MKKALVLCLGLIIGASALSAQTIYPINNADIFEGFRFDFKVEFPTTIAETDVKITVNGKSVEAFLGAKPVFQVKDGDVEASAVWVRNASLAKAGTYTVVASDGKNSKTVIWNIVALPKKSQAKNVIFLIADGLSMGHRTAARLMSKGMTEGKYNGNLAMDMMDSYGTVGTGSVDSIAADSANTASAYNTGHKSSVNALGVYADRTKDPLDDPRQETMAEFLKRTTKKSVGIVSDAEIEDATPASVFAHTRRRDEKAVIAEQLLALQPDVILGGGSAYLLPQSVTGSKRKDDKNLIEMATKAGYSFVQNNAELTSVKNPTKLLGLFHTGNMDGWMDRNITKKATVSKFPDQPDVTQMTQSALDVLSKNKNGFYLQVEAGLVDKFTHPLDWERAAYDTIMFDKTVAIALEFAKKNPGTLVVVTGDHTHSISVVGTVDDNAKGEEMRDKVGVYEKAGYPNYVDANKDGYPDSPDVSKRLFVVIGNHPDYYETFKPKMDAPFAPAVQDDKKNYIANEAYKASPGALFMAGNLPKDQSTGVHAVDDVVISASGPGSNSFKGFMENSAVFRKIAEALLGQ